MEIAEEVIALRQKLELAAPMLWARLWQHAVQGSTHDELLEEAPHIA